MSAASPAQTQVRRTAAAAPSQATTRVYDFSKPRGEDEIRVNLADVPVMRTSIDADVFAPTLLSRLFDLFGPRR
ncbi:hypothetical protein GCM10011487_09860 [Steroidobacter agaridevorans]|uniref:Uncharacterized protein n=1 Tax=Steroidobacter agaridevorans TaxID=2695856 RepID=A0A829Y868_9GAMM|nr:hypothetical protein [Steroidobacter agaridevorans]GFE78986.1 hypothetical protein GCM10011487_09860 [Steroidobacter agaridevorans]GFE88141.1 hypothetical protein GCM10011488_30950 [Steroidobacter agaridevorans]